MTFAKRELAGQNLYPIGLGCMSLSHAYLPCPDKDEALRLLHRAIDIGYKHFDSARIYGRGGNETLLSKVLQTRREQMFITSKCGIEIDGDKRYIDCRPETIKRAVDKSLKTFAIDHIDLYYLHRRDFNTSIEESVGALAELKKQGKIGAIGLSEMSAETLQRANAETKIAAVQTEYSLWTRNPELGVLDMCEKLGVAFIAFSPLARGVLANGVSEPDKLIDGDLRKNHPRFNAENWPKNFALVQKFNALADEAGTTPAQLALIWVLSRGDHVHVIPGTGNINHMEENFVTPDGTVGDDILKRAGDLINQSSVAGHRYPEAMHKTIDTEEFAA